MWVLRKCDDEEYMFFQAGVKVKIIHAAILTIPFKNLPQFYGSKTLIRWSICIPCLCVEVLNGCLYMLAL